MICVQAPPKYHIYVEYAETDKSGIRFNVPQEELVRTFSSPFTIGQPFWFLGKLLNPTKVIKAVIFWSYQAADKLTLPNQENLVAAKEAVLVGFLQVLELFFGFYSLFAVYSCVVVSVVFGHEFVSPCTLNV